MAQNPCIEDNNNDNRRDAQERECREGYERDENGVCVPVENLRAQPPSYPTPPEDPFVVSALEPPINRLPSVNIEEQPDANSIFLPDIKYVAATREITTLLDASFYIPESVDSIIQTPSSRLILPWRWLRQKEDNGVVQMADRFRLSLANFWGWSGRQIPRITSGHVPEKVMEPPRNRAAGPISTNAEFGPYNRANLIPYNFTPSAGVYRFIRVPVPSTGPDGPVDESYQTVDMVPFRYHKPAIDRYIADRNLGGVPDIEPKIYDIILEGQNSPAWQDPDLQEIFENSSATVSMLRAGTIEYNRTKFDMTFDSPAPFLESEVDNILVPPTNMIKINTVINSQEINKDVATERAIPSIYQFYQSKQLEKIIDQDEGVLEFLPPGQVAFAQQTIVNFDEMSNVNDFESPEVLKFPSDRVEKFQEINEILRGSISNYVEISIKTNQSRPINSSLHKNKMDIIVLEALDQIMTHFEHQVAFRAAAPLASPISEHFNLGTTFTKILDDRFIEADSATEHDMTLNDKYVSGVPEPVIFYIDKIISMAKDIRERSWSWPSSENRTPRQLTGYPLYYSGWDNKNLLLLEEMIRSQLFLNSLNSLISNGSLYRFYSDILSGKKAYAEVIGYRVDKYRITTNEEGVEEEERVQRFFFMDNDNVSEMNFIDSQVIPGRKYKYKIFTLNFVLGTKYIYSDLPALTQFSWKNRSNGNFLPASPANNTFWLSAFAGTVPSIMAAPFFEKTVSLMDKPPLPPQVSFLPFQGIDYEHAILLQSNSGERVEVPIKILDSDQEEIENIYRAQFRRSGSEVLYKSDSLPTGFEVMRLETPPESYADFSHPDAVVFRTDASGKTALVRVGLEPNKYYYYTFRTYDEGGISNPTGIFRARIVSYQNGIFMEMEPYEMRSSQEEYKFSFERMLEISPSLSQKAINFSKRFEEIEEGEQQSSESAIMKIRKDLGLRDFSSSPDFQRSSPSKDLVSLGIEKERDLIWDKKFKIRVTSKTTGKKIDLNISFSHTKRSLGEDS